jgi:hypothetical protein
VSQRNGQSGSIDWLVAMLLAPLALAGKRRSSG